MPYDAAESEKQTERDPENRPVVQPCGVREKMLDKTLADSFPTSDPPSTIPDPTSDSFDAEEASANPYDRLTHADTQDAERQPLPGDKPFDRQPQSGEDKRAA